MTGCYRPAPLEQDFEEDAKNAIARLGVSGVYKCSRSARQPSAGYGYDEGNGCAVCASFSRGRELHR